MSPHMHLTQSPWETINLNTPTPSRHNTPNNSHKLVESSPYSDYVSISPSPTPSQTHEEVEEDDDDDDDDNDDEHTAFTRTPLFHPSVAPNLSSDPYPYPYAPPYRDRYGYSYYTFPPISPATTITSSSTTTTSTGSNGNGMKDGAEVESCYFETLDFSDYQDTFGNSGGDEAEIARRTRQGWQAARESVAVVCMVFLVVVGLVVMGWAVAGVVGAVWGEGGKFVAVNGGSGSEKGDWAPCTAARPRFCRFVVGAGGQ